MIEGPKYSTGGNREPFKQTNKFGDGRESKQEISGDFISRKYEVESIADKLDLVLDDAGIAVETKNIFERLNKDYHIPGKVNVVLSEGKEGPIINLLSKKIDGVQLKMRPDGHNFNISLREKIRLTSEMSNLFTGLTKYALENSKSNNFMWDIAGADQYMWGKQKDENGLYDKEPHLYLVDIGLNMSDTGLSTFIGDLLPSIKNYEFFLETKFIEARKNLQKMVDAGLVETEQLESINGLHS